MEDLRCGLPRTPNSGSATSENAGQAKFAEFAFRDCLENRERGVSAVPFADVRRENRPLCPSCRLMEVPALGLVGISKQFLQARLYPFESKSDRYAPHLNAAEEIIVRCLPPTRP